MFSRIGLCVGSNRPEDFYFLFFIFYFYGVSIYTMALPFTLKKYVKKAKKEELWGENSNKK
jgi:hypothetical protein